MESSVNSLPNEILERIFSYCTHEDLVLSIQNVCCRWRDVSQSTSVWKDVTYCPERNTRPEQVVEMLRISPKLQNIILRYNYGDIVLQAITVYCAELRKLEIHVSQVIRMAFIKILQEKCPNIEYLNIPHPVVTYLHGCQVTGKFTNLKVLHLTGCEHITFSVFLKPVADYCKNLEHLELENFTFQMSDLRYFLTMRKDTLHTLGVGCCDYSGECVLPALSTCDLKSLSLFRFSLCQGHYEKVEHLGRLKTVQALSISAFGTGDDFKLIFENGNMAQLVELRLGDSLDLDDDIIEVIVRNCPLLKKVSLKRLENMTDASLKKMRNLKELNCLTISGNSSVTDTGIKYLRRVKNLERLTISWSNLGLQKIAKLRTLQALTLEFQDLAEFPWDLIPHRMQFLQYLRLHRCINVDICAIEKLKIELPCLKVREVESHFQC